jgi:uncharacterized repeat protein (TIGR03803 family)
MRITPSGPVRLTLAVFVIAFMCAGNAGAATEKILHSFNAVAHGYLPSSGLLADAAGNLYGTTFAGGTQGWGTVYKLTPNARGGWTEHVLYNFTNGADGSEPVGGLIFDQAGNLYGANSGTATSVGTCCGTIFKLTPSGNTWKLSVLYTFTEGAQGGFPNGNLVFDGAGNLYGTASFGGDSIDPPCFDEGCGTVFELSPSSGSWTFSLLYTFTGGADGAQPNGGLIFDQAGALYGTTSTYGTASCSVNPGCGAVFKLTPSGNTWTTSVLYSFTGGTDGSNPSGPLLFDQTGNLYGMTSRGGSCTPLNCGVVFELMPSGGNWTESVLYAFTGGADGANPAGRLSFDQAGSLYGAAAAFGSSACGTVFQLAPSASGWTQSVLHSFQGLSDGCNPGDVILTASGNLFGTAPRSGPANSGAVFELTPANGSWKESTVFGFLGTDGSQPYGSALILDSTGSLYGTTGSGGSAELGSVFKLTPNSQGGWTESMIYSFKDSATGENPRSGLVFDTQGNLYGITTSGGLPSCSPYGGCGVVFKLKPSGTGWTQSVIHAFSGTDGSYPQGPLVLDAAGNLYGATQSGGTFGFGTVFKLAPSSGGLWKETVLYNFTGGTDGSQLLGGLVFDQAGNLYGATSIGGVSGYGTVFKLAPSNGGAWTETVLHSFTNGFDSGYPQGPLALDAAGNLYGSTTRTVFELSPSGGGWTLTTFRGLPGIPSPVILDAAGNLYGTTSSGTTYGSVFQLTPGSGGWTETILYSFTGPPLDGASPSGGLTRDAAGNLYGATGGGGVVGAGTVFEITP